MHTSRHRRAVLLSIAMGTGMVGSLFAATAASAANNDGVCNTGERCGWRDSNLSGGMADWAGNDGNFTDESNGDDAMHGTTGIQIVANSGDRISSVRNRETFTIYFHGNSNCGGDDTQLVAGATLASMPGGGGEVGDNEASSQASTTSC